MERRRHEQVVESSAPVRPARTPRDTTEYLRWAAIIGVLTLAGAALLGILSIIDALRGHPLASWHAFLSVWDIAWKLLVLGGVVIVAYKIHQDRAHTALPRAEARELNTQTKIRWETHKHNKANMPKNRYIALSDEFGNYGQMIDVESGYPTGYLLPGNSPTGNTGIPGSQVFKYLESMNTRVVEEPVKQIAAPSPVILLSAQIELGLTAPDERESVFGYPVGNYEPKRVQLFEQEGNFINSLFVIGEQGQGKSTIGTYLAALTVNHRGYILVIDPDAEEGQSLSSRLGPLKNFLLAPIADTPDKAKDVLDLAEREIEDPGDYPLLLLVDEFSMIMRAKKLGGKWKAVADRVASEVENFATRGRKRRRRVVVFGQISNASRTGGTELRDVCAAVVFNTAVKKAERVLDNAADEEIAEFAPSLTPGQAIVLPAGSSETFIMQFPMPDARGLQIIAEAIAESDELMTGNAGRVLGDPGRVGIERAQDGLWARRQQWVVDANSASMQRNTGALENGIDQPLETLGESPNTRLGEYPLMNEPQVQRFIALYPLMGTDKALDEIPGCAHKHREHAREIIRQSNLQRKKER